MTIHLEDIPLTQPELSAYLRERRGQAGLLQSDIAVGMGVTSKAVTSIENRKCESRGSTILRYLEACGCTIKREQVLELPHDMDALRAIVGRENTFCPTIVKECRHFLFRSGDPIWNNFHDFMRRMNLELNIPREPGRWLRDHRYIPLHQFAMESGLNMTSLSTWENGGRSLKLSTMLKWLAFLDIPLIATRTENPDA